MIRSGSKGQGITAISFGAWGFVRAFINRFLSGYFFILFLFLFTIHDNADQYEDENQDAGRAPNDDAHTLVVNEPHLVGIHGRLDFGTLAAL